MQVLTTKLVNLMNKTKEGHVIEWELDLWYETWDRVGSEGLDVWRELEGGEGRAREAGDEFVSGFEGTGEGLRGTVLGWEGG